MNTKHLGVVALSVWTALAVSLTTYAQSVTTIYSFTNGPANPNAGMALGPDGNFYGTTSQGGTGDAGVVFQVATNGTVTTLVNFNGINGATPYAGLTLGQNGNFYGTTSHGGADDAGVVFQVTTNGTLTTLVNFNGTNGAVPYGGLTLGSDGNFYGTTGYGGSEGYGTVFQVTTNGALTTLVNFNKANGATPYASLTLGPDGNFYGTTELGGSIYNEGTLFQVTTNGTLTTLINFNDNVGMYPNASLTLGPDGNLYGTTSQGGIRGGYGTVFQVTTNGTWRTLVDFNYFNGGGPGGGLTVGPDGTLYGTTTADYGTVFQVTTNGAFKTLVNFLYYAGNSPPLAGSPPNGLTLGVDGNFYGTTQGGGSGGLGTIFKMTTNGTLTTLANFTDANGSNPNASLTLGADGNFYGTTAYGGIADVIPGGIAGGNGTAFRVTTSGTLTTLVNFNGDNGASPNAALSLGSDGNFYGTTTFGGSGSGTLFRMTPNGTLTTLDKFGYQDPNNPEASLTLGPDGNFYGTSEYGGDIGRGTVFQVTTNGTVTPLADFPDTNGANPEASLTLGPDGNFYGTTYAGGGDELGSDYGTVFRMTPNGTLTTLVNFDDYNGANPEGGLTLGPDGNFYGTTTFGCYAYGFGEVFGGNGCVFRMTTNGTMTVMALFVDTNGDNPSGNLTLGPDGNLYGTTYAGGTSSNGTVFRMTTNGALTTLINFNGTNGASPQAGLTLGPDGNFYGTTFKAGSGGGGTVFQLQLPPEFITAPTNQAVTIGGSVSFNSQVFGTGPFAYQWLSNGVPITGATNATLSVSPALTNAIGNYQLVVSNVFGSVASQPVSLIVLVQPNIYAISNNAGGNFSLSLASLPNSTNRLWATTNPALSFAQWQVIATNVMDGNGLGQYLDTNTAGMLQKFYRLSCP